MAMENICKEREMEMKEQEQSWQQVMTVIRKESIYLVILNWERILDQRTLQTIQECYGLSLFFMLI